MQYMTKTKALLCGLFLLTVVRLSAQSNALSDSPYSVFGIGIPNAFSTGKTNALGGAGIALKSDNSLNALNPASLGAMPVKHFFFDIGYTSQYTSLSQGSRNGTQSISSFSNLAMAFPVTKESAVSLILAPYSKVGYNLSGVTTSIEGSTSFYTSDVEANGGVNSLDLNYGYSFWDKLRLGVTGTYYFGKTEQTTYNDILGYSLDIQEESRYTGYRLGAGLQFDLNQNISLGSTLKLPATLETNQKSIISQDYDDDITDETSLDNFDLPLEIGFGLEFKFGKNYAFYTDYIRKSWSNTQQADALDYYKDQEEFKAGITFTPHPGGLYYWQNIEYRAGINYDTGYLTIAGTDIDQYSLSLGLGLPVSRSGSKLNLMYSYGQNGTRSNNLVFEKIHSLSINFSLDGIWFVKSKYN